MKHHKTDEKNAAGLYQQETDRIAFAASRAAATLDKLYEWQTKWIGQMIYGLKPGESYADLPYCANVLAENDCGMVAASQPAAQRIEKTQQELERRIALYQEAFQDDGAAVFHLSDYAAITALVHDLAAQMRRIERAFSSAASGIDSLTGIKSRLSLWREMERERARFLRRGDNFCVAICDIDHFKHINDSYGHDTGDRVLSAIADTIIKSLRVFDDVYRMGGEEFLIILKSTDLENGRMAMERLRQDIAALELHALDGDVIRVTASFGISKMHDSVSCEVLLEMADMALYRAKHHGRNRVELAMPS